MDTWQTDLFGYIKVQMSLIDPLKMKVWGTEAQRYAWRNRDRLLLSPHIDFTYKGFLRQAGKYNNCLAGKRGISAL